MGISINNTSISESIEREADFDIEKILPEGKNRSGETEMTVAVTDPAATKLLGKIQKNHITFKGSRVYVSNTRT